LADDFEVKCVEFPEISTSGLNKIFSPERLKTFKPFVQILSLGESGIQDNSIVLPKGKYLELAQPSSNFLYHSDSKKTGEAYLVLENKGAYKPMGRLAMDFTKEKGNTCSAGLIWFKALKKYGLITAAHCIYSHEYNLWAKTVVFLPNEGFPMGVDKKWRIIKAYLNYGWLKNEIQTKYLYDLALLVLEPLSETPDTFGLSIFPDKSLLKGTSMGFPVEGRFGDNGNVKYATEILDFNWSPKEDYYGTYVIQSDMHKGASGGPWVGKGKNNNFGFIFGLNSFHRPNKLDKEFGPVFGDTLFNQWQKIHSPSFQCEKIK
jgi:hypothetical protein